MDLKGCLRGEVKTCLILAAERSNLAVVEILSEWFPGIMVLHFAASLCDCTIVKYTLNTNQVTNINAIDDRGRTALSVTVLCQCTPNILALLSKNADTTIKDKESGECSFHFAARYGYAIIVRMQVSPTIMVGNLGL